MINKLCLSLNFSLIIVYKVMGMGAKLAMSNIPNHAVYGGPWLAWTHPKPVVDCFDNREFFSSVVYYGNEMNEISSL